MYYYIQHTVTLDIINIIIHEAYSFIAERLVIVGKLKANSCSSAAAQAKAV